MSEPLPDPLPARVAELLAERIEVGERSEASARFVVACVRAGLTDGQVLAAAHRHQPTVDRHRTDASLAADVGRCVAHARAQLKTDAARLDAWVASAAPSDTEPTRLVMGGAFILDRPPGVPARWGEADAVLWARGEPFGLVSPTGVGKTTIAGQLVEGLVGLRDGHVLGYPVEPADRVLYLACDRPTQIARSMGRLFSDIDRAVLDERLVFWKGPPTADLAKNPLELRALARHAGADVVFVDSAKDVALKLSDDDVGAGLNSALQHVIADGRDVAVLHHQRKRQQGGGKPNTLDDVYGSTWLTAGMGSVVLLWGRAGDPIVELTHLKQPAAEVGPFRIAHDHNTGRSTVEQGPPDPLKVLRSSPQGLTAGQLARLGVNGRDPTDTERKKAERNLDRLVRDGLARKEDGKRGGIGGSVPARYHAIDELDGWPGAKT